ncbi:MULTISPECIES: Maf family protein [unclassified Enterococcus]|uniref:Maf family protein n=1 Tax=unclassified Enterococcus TaxID=2608891 RepID=UPI0013EA14D5|nr:MULTISPECIES: Maf family protein [unclassified Enterococcus]
MKIILASQSPRRKELLAHIEPVFDIQPADIDETPYEGESPVDYVQRMAAEKAAAVWEHRAEEAPLIIASDTTIVWNGEIMGKPKNQTEAEAMLKKLSGQTHKVYTAVMLKNSNQEETILAEAKVTFYPLTEAEISRYLATGDYADKAGAYGIQNAASVFVKEISGDYYSIVGFPVGAVNQALKKMKV